MNRGIDVKDELVQKSNNVENLELGVLCLQLLKKISECQTQEDLLGLKQEAGQHIDEVIKTCLQPYANPGNWGVTKNWGVEKQNRWNLGSDGYQLAQEALALLSLVRDS